MGLRRARGTDLVESIHPPVFGPVEYSDPRKVIPRSMSRCLSMRLWRDFSSVVNETVCWATWSDVSLKRLRSDLVFQKSWMAKSMLMYSSNLLEKSFYREDDVSSLQFIEENFQTWVLAAFGEKHLAFGVFL